METFAYLIRVNIAIVVCYAAYRIFFRNDTFFAGKRILLISLLLLSFAYPFLSLGNLDFLTHFSQNRALFPEILLREVIITSDVNQAAETAASTLDLPTLLGFAYFAVLICLIIRILIQTASIFFMISKTKPELAEGQKIRRKDGLSTPFSFFGYIVIDPSQHESGELREILRHEATHVRQVHSLDMSLAEIICAVCWFNPCAWLLKREIRWNLEFLADRSTLNSGCDREHYQFHLLRLTYQKTVFQLVNNFNVSPLKKRILMMNKKQTSGKSAAKYLLVLPLTVAALLAYNSFDATGQDAKKKSTTQEVGDSVPPSKLIDSAVLVSDTGGVATYSIPGDADVSIEVRTIDGAKDKKSDIYTLAEQMPAFPGGEQELMKYIAKNLSYPEDCAKNNIQGTVALRFVVGADGSIGDITVVKPLHSSCDSAAVNAVRNMPKWTPGKINGEAVNVYYSVPIRFKL